MTRNNKMAKALSNKKNKPDERKSSFAVALAPLRAKANTFVKAFADCVHAGGLEVYDYTYETELPKNINCIIFHWPNEFFVGQSEQRNQELRHLLSIWQEAQKQYGLRLIWVAHNVHPHDRNDFCLELRTDFINALDGIIYLSARSRDIIHEAYAPDVTRELVTVHGHYRDNSSTRPQPLPPIDAVVRLCYFGRIRPYKNLDTLIDCMSTLTRSQALLSITGFRLDQAYASRLEDLAQGRSDIQLDLRSHFVPEEDLEAVIDQSHGIILPYRDILNSGAALLALSRNRPVLAPRLGSLPELQGDVGEDWLHLYDTALNSTVLQEFIDRLRKKSPEQCNLSAYDWGPIGQSVCRFIEQVCADDK
ncbi:hypothetical protein [Methylocapsa sp. S129]|uniref:hypothetical protein n=1 Tax=Methylocapsa sp. S129 TaxID=1641869 RepID=UPI00131C505D|nr:hypothetical protein [Methylocapsa sp. S129]